MANLSERKTYNIGVSESIGVRNTPIVSSIYSKFSPLVSGTIIIINSNKMILTIPKMMKVFDSPTRSCSGANANATKALNPKFTSVISPTARPRVQV